MKKVIFIVVMFFASMLLMTSCILDSISDGFEKHKKGVIESKDDLLGVSYYQCSYVGKDEEHPDGTPYENTYLGTTEVYWEDESCASLGYKHSGDMTFFNKDGSEYPGENGDWGDDGDDPNTPAFCTGYVSPCTDPQVNPFCESAYNARCILGVPATDDRVTYPCSDYAGFQQLNPAIADCEYCE